MNTQEKEENNEEKNEKIENKGEIQENQIPQTIEEVTEQLKEKNIIETQEDKQKKPSCKCGCVVF